MKKIGIPLWKTGENSIGVTVAYMQLAELFGEVILLPPKHITRKDLDLLILPGGLDINPINYNQYPDWNCGKQDLQKEFFDKYHLPKYIQNGTPIFSICRGMQALGVHFKGTLHQDMSHETNPQTDPYKTVHGIKLLHESFDGFKNFTNKSYLNVNSRHHQAINKESIAGSPLVTIATHSANENHVEMVAHANLPIVGVQFHPEDVNDNDTSDFVYNIMEYLIRTRKSIFEHNVL